jgi:ArsR family transcriptional regulator
MSQTEAALRQGLADARLASLTLDDFELNRTAAAIKALAHPMRLKLLCLLGNGEMSVQGLSAHFRDTSQSNISQHLSHMLERAVLINRKEGNQVFYSVRDRSILGIVGAVKSVFCDELA